MELKPQAPEVRIIDSAAGWKSIAPAWNALFDSSPNASTPLSFDWMWHWWQVYGGRYGHHGLRIVSFWRESDLVGVLPCYVGRGRGAGLGERQLRWLSTGEDEAEETCADYLDLLHAPGEGEACARLAWQAMADMPWHLLELLEIPASSPLVSAASGSAQPVDGLRRLDRGSCAIARLDGGFEAYLAGLSSKTRMRARQELRKFEREGASFELARPEQAESFFADLVALHQKRWTDDGKPGCFAAERFTRFHRALVHEWLPSGRAVLASLSSGGIPLAVLYGFVLNNRFELYQLGVDRDNTGVIHSPGTLANLLLMSRMADQGVVEYDFLRGQSGFKRSLTDTQRPLVAFRAHRAGLRPALTTVLERMAATKRKLQRRRSA